MLCIIYFSNKTIYFKRLNKCLCIIYLNNKTIYNYIIKNLNKCLCIFTVFTDSHCTYNFL